MIHPGMDDLTYFRAVEHAYRSCLIVFWFSLRALPGRFDYDYLIYSLDLISSIFLASKPKTNKSQANVFLNSQIRNEGWNGVHVFHVFSSKHAFTISRGTCMHACHSLQRGFGLIYKTCTVHAMTCAKIGFQPRRCISSFLENTNQRQCDYELHARGSDTNSAHLLSLHVTLNMYKESQSNTFFCFQFETPVDGISHGREMLMQACICFSSYAYVHTYIHTYIHTWIILRPQIVYYCSAHFRCRPGRGPKTAEVQSSTFWARLSGMFALLELSSWAFSAVLKPCLLIFIHR